MRVTSEFWVSALCRNVSGQGAFAAVLRRGAKEAGSIFVVTTRLDGLCDLWAPAPQSCYEDGDRADRHFECVLEQVDQAEITGRLDREVKFDPDIWVVEIEDKQGRKFF